MWRGARTDRICGRAAGWCFLNCVLWSEGEFYFVVCEGRRSGLLFAQQHLVGQLIRRMVYWLNPAVSHTCRPLPTENKCFPC